MTSSDKQVGGAHYTSLGIQPFEITERNFGYQGLRASVYTKVNKYLSRDKGGFKKHIEDIEKSIHCLEIQLEAARKHYALTELDTVTVNSGPSFNWVSKEVVDTPTEQVPEHIPAQVRGLGQRQASTRSPLVERELQAFWPDARASDFENQRDPSVRAVRAQSAALSLDGADVAYGYNDIHNWP